MFPLEKESAFLRYFQDDDQGGDDEISGAVVGFDAGILSVELIASSYDNAPLVDTSPLTVTFVNGVYLEVVVTESAADAGDVSVEFIDGVYFNTVIDEDLLETVDVGVQFIDGVYLLIVVPESQTEIAVVNPQFIDGEYVLVVIPADPQAEAGSVAVAFLTGTYA